MSIDINFYTIPEARRSNLRHRPVGLGHHGLPGRAAHAAPAYASDEAVRFADESMEAVSFHAIAASVDLAAGARPLSDLRRLALDARHSADRLAWRCWARRAEA